MINNHVIMVVIFCEYIYYRCSFLKNNVIMIRTCYIYESYELYIITKNYLKFWICLCSILKNLRR